MAHSAVTPPSPLPGGHRWVLLDPKVSWSSWHRTWPFSLGHSPCGCGQPLWWPSVISHVLGTWVCLGWAFCHLHLKYSDQIRSDQSLSRVRLFATPWIAARQASLSLTNILVAKHPKCSRSLIPDKGQRKNITLWSLTLCPSFDYQSGKWTPNLLWDRVGGRIWNLFYWNFVEVLTFFPHG